MTFEEYTKRLEEISAKLESEDISLDESIKLFEESVKLSALCMEILKDRKGKITQIKQELDSITTDGDDEL